MNLRSLDLNLLVVLDALLEERHVTRAAERLGLSQPATSSALSRLRALLRDPLLERTRGGMRPTPRAEALRGPLRAILAEVGALFAEDVPLDRMRGTVRLAMADFPATVALGPLVRDLGATAPGLDLVVQPWGGAAEARAALAEGRTDIAVSLFSGSEDELHRAELLREEYVVALRAGHPVAPEFGLEAWLGCAHLLVSARGEARGAADTALARLGRARRVGLVVPSFGMAPSVLAETDLVALLPSRCVPADGRFATFAPPVPVEGFSLQLAWHRRRAGDRALRHVAEVLGRVLA